MRFTLQKPPGYDEKVSDFYASLSFVE